MAENTAVSELRQWRQDLKSVMFDFPDDTYEGKTTRYFFEGIIRKIELILNTVKEPVDG